MTRRLALVGRMVFPAQQHVGNARELHVSMANLLNYMNELTSVVTSDMQHGFQVIYVAFYTNLVSTVIMFTLMSKICRSG